MTSRLGSWVLLAAVAAAAPGCFISRAVGITHPGENEAVSGDTAEEMYAKAQRAYAAEDWPTAADSFGKLWRDFPKSGLASDAQFYEAESRYQQGKLHGAFELYKRYMKEWPLSAHVPVIEKRIYDLGTKTIEDGQHGFIGIFDYASEGVEELDYLVATFPHGNQADDALIYMADYEGRTRQTRAAIDHLHDLVDNYPNSEWALEARLRLAKAYRDVNRGVSYDADALKRSCAQYRAYIDIVSADAARKREYATQLDNARSELAEVEEQLAQKSIDASDFYLRSGNADAARSELKNCVRDYPKSRAADEARGRLGVESSSGGGGDKNP
jgi:outer membrane assembly lipoprotein YfiO